VSVDAAQAHPPTPATPNSPTTARTNTHSRLATHARLIVMFVDTAPEGAGRDLPGGYNLSVNCGYGGER
jgi:hypothetical protein